MKKSKNGTYLDVFALLENFADKVQKRLNPEPTKPPALDVSDEADLNNFSLDVVPSKDAAVGKTETKTLPSLPQKDANADGGVSFKFA